MIDFAIVYDALRHWAQDHHINAADRPMQPGKAGEFDGVSLTMNSSYYLEERSHYFVHALGSIVGWSLRKDETQGMFDELRNAKNAKDPARLEPAIERYRAFEIESSEFAVWLLDQLGQANVIPSYTNFMRADLEALTIFHRTGQAPVWESFFATWNQEVAAGRRQVSPYRAKEIPAFVPVVIEKQEILQEQPSSP